MSGFFVANSPEPQSDKNESVIQEITATGDAYQIFNYSSSYLEASDFV